MKNVKQKLSVIHSNFTWLPLTQNWMHSLVESIPRHLVQSHIVCDKRHNASRFEFPSIHELASQSPMKFFLNRIFAKSRVIRYRCRDLRQKIEQLEADIVHSHFGNVGVSNLEVVKKTNAKHVITFYGYDISKLPYTRTGIKSKYKRLFQHADMVFCEGPFMAGKAVELGCPSEKVQVQHLGVDLSLFDYRPRRWRPGTPLKILLSGSFREKKGIPFAIRAIGELSKQIDLSVTIVGDSDQSSSSLAEKERILTAIKEHNLESRVDLQGYQTHQKLTEFAYDHHIFVSTSVQAQDGDNEGGAPVTLIEMAATGMPIISSFHCDIPNVIIDRQTGWLAEERNVPSIIQCIEDALSAHNEWYNVLRSGRERIEREFDLATQGTKLAGHYWKIVETPGEIRNEHAFN